MMAGFPDNSELPFLSPVEFPNKAIINVGYSTINAPTMIQGELYYDTECNKGGGGSAPPYIEFSVIRGSMGMDQQGANNRGSM